ncbi:MAG: Acyl-CoA dehydrogenase [Acidimicrobiales bacterium]|nr:Acyl-CoA dehydrogenase [Acidimicrobiales bacterium]
MNPVLPQEAVEFAGTARRAFESLGGVDVARRAEADPDSREDVAKLLADLGVDELDPLADPEQAAAAAALCEAAGRVALPYPVGGVVLRSAAGLPVAAVPAAPVRVDHGDLFDMWLACGPAGETMPARAVGAPLGTRLGPFVTDLEPVGGAAEDVLDPASGQALLAWWLTLSAWTILGGLDRAVELATAHAQDRIQFGQPLTAFQTVRFQLADAAIAVAGLRELALFTLWRLHAAPDHAWPDVVALRSHALDVARPVLRATQQLHGASGLCDEVDICVLVRHLQPALRLPAGAEDTARELAAAIATDGFDGLFPHGATAGDRTSA